MSEELTRFIETVVPETHLRVEKELGDGFVVLRRDEAERRQAAQDVRCSEDVLIEVLRNSRDAGATRIFVATCLEAGVRTLVVADNGSGIPAAMTELVFEPRVTSKLDSVHMDKWGIHGRGMALYSIRQNCLVARVCKTAPGLGTALVAQSAVERLPEKTDQSSFPTFSLQEDGKVKISGPRNLLRTAAEFALEHRNQIAVYLGSPTEIAASMLAAGMERYSLAELSLLPAADVPFIDRPAFVHSSAQLANLLDSLGLKLSERSCRRIMDGEIAPLAPLHEQIRDLLRAPGATQPTQTGKTLFGKRPAKRAVANIRPAREDLRALEAELAEAFRPFAEKYYLDADVAPTTRVKNGQLTVNIPLLPREE